MCEHARSLLCFSKKGQFTCPYYKDNSLVPTSDNSLVPTTKNQLWLFPLQRNTFCLWVMSKKGFTVCQTRVIEILVAVCGGADTQGDTFWPTAELARLSSPGVLLHVSTKCLGRKTWSLAVQKTC